MQNSNYLRVFLLHKIKNLNIFKINDKKVKNLQIILYIAVISLLSCYKSAIFIMI